MKIELKYGQQRKHLCIPEKGEVSVFEPKTLPVIDDVEKAFEAAMVCSCSDTKFDAMDGPESVAIAVPDETRPTPLKVLLPLVLKRLHQTFPRLSPKKIKIIFGAGLHPPLDDRTMRRLLPNTLESGYPIVSHDAFHSEMTDYGKTSLGTPVQINSHFADADFKLVIGNIDPHQFVGFTGGAKGAVIGCGSKETIEANHSLMLREKAALGNIEDNPVRSDIDEAGGLIGIPIVVDVVLDSFHRIVHILSGDPVSVYRAGAEICKTLYGVAIKKKFDIVLASCGGYPKDINLYQAQKGLAHVTPAVKPGGKILLLASCPQGVGDRAYFDYVSKLSGPDAVIADFQTRKFRMGAHKAFLFAKTLLNFDVYIASKIRPQLLAKCHLKACHPQQTIDRLIKSFPGQPTIAVIPNANTTYLYPS
jgi:nickel-dependent lactate racemase